jgi:hypothetical protein
MHGLLISIYISLFVDIGIFCVGDLYAVFGTKRHILLTIMGGSNCGDLSQPRRQSDRRKCTAVTTVRGPTAIPLLREHCATFPSFMLERAHSSTQRIAHNTQPPRLQAFTACSPGRISPRSRDMFNFSNIDMHRFDMVDIHFILFR